MAGQTRTQTGTRLFVASVTGTALGGTCSNANPCVVDLGAGAHGITTSGVVILQTGWGELNNRAFAVTVIDANSFSLDGIDTTDTTFFPAASNSATSTTASAFKEITQFTGFETSGGDAQSAKYQYIHDPREQSVFDKFSAIERKVTFDAAIKGTENEILLSALTRSQKSTAYRVLSRTGDYYLFNATIALNTEVIHKAGGIDTLNAAIFSRAAANNYTATA